MNTWCPKSILWCVFVLFNSLSLFAANFLIDGSNRLNTISIPNTGVHHIQFTGGGYKNPGKLILSNNGSDTLIFEKLPQTDSLAEADSAVTVDSIFMNLQGQKNIVFRNLAFKMNRSGVFFDTTQGLNQNLIFENCKVFGDSAFGGKVFKWSGTNSSIKISNSMFSGTGGIALTGTDSIVLSNNLFNFSGVFSVWARKNFEMKYNTVNRAQFLLDGNGLAFCQIQNNYFANPPFKNNLEQEDTLKFVTYLNSKFKMPGSVVTNNIRDSTWTGYESTAWLFSDSSSNKKTASTKDSTVAWDWKIPSDTNHGAWNGPRPLPNFNVFPKDSIFSFPMSGGSVIFNMAAFQLPQLLTAAWGTTPYANALPDSVRSWFLRDTTLILSGPATVKSISLPSKNEGKPLLFSKVGLNFMPNTMGSEGSSTFSNTYASKIFIPSFAGQNTYRGNNVSIQGFGTETAVLFSTVTRSGRTSFHTPSLPSTNKRLRTLQKSGAPLGLGLTTNAESTGSLKIGISKIGADTAFLSDSVFYEFGTGQYIKALDSANRWWGSFVSKSSLDIIAREKLALGAGLDTLVLAQGHRVFSNSTLGFQLATDSIADIDTSQIFNLAFYSRPLSFQTTGRKTTDSLKLEIKKSFSFQTAFKQQTNKATIPVTPLIEDATKLIVHIPVMDSSKYFLARKYSLPSGTLLNFAIGEDSVSGLISSQPGELSLDSAFNLTLDTLRLLTKRQLVLDHLSPSNNFTVWLKGLAPVRAERLVAYIRQAGNWIKTSVATLDNRYKLVSPKNSEAWLVGERLVPQDTLPIRPILPATATVSLGKLILVIRLDSLEGLRTLAVHVQALFINAQGHSKFLSNTGSPDSPLQISIPLGNLGMYRMGYENIAGRITWDSIYTAIPYDALSLSTFVSFANTTAPTYRAFIKELVGFPQKQLASQLISLDIEKESVLKAWNGVGWFALPTNTTFIRGQGYLLGLPKNRNPALDTVGLSITPDTVVLKVGWNCISSPLPFPYLESKIQLDTSAVSYFYALNWTGEGKNAKPNWILSDTLRPFKGYMIYASKATQLVFNPWINLPLSAGHGAEVKAVELKWTLIKSGETAILRMGNSVRNGILPPFFPADFQAVWKEPMGSSSQNEMAETDLFIHASTSGEVRLNPFGSLQGRALWIPTSQRLVELSDTSLEMEAGWNGFKLLDVEPGKIREIEAKLRGLSSIPGSLKAKRLGAFLQVEFLLPIGVGLAEQVEVNWFNLSGQRLGGIQWGQLLSGSHVLSFPSPSSDGLLFIQVRFKTRNREQTLTLRFVNTFTKSERAP